MRNAVAVTDVHKQTQIVLSVNQPSSQTSTFVATPAQALQVIVMRVQWSLFPAATQQETDICVLLQLNMAHTSD